MKNSKTSVDMFIHGFRKRDAQRKIKTSRVVWIIPTAIASIIFTILFAGGNMSVCEKHLDVFTRIKITYNLYNEWLIYGLIFAFFLGVSVFLTITRYNKEITALDKLNTSSVIGAIITLIVGGIIEFRDGFYAGGGYGFICFFLFMYFTIHIAISKAKKSGRIITGYNSTGPKLSAVKDLFTLVDGRAIFLSSSASVGDDGKYADE